LARDSKHTNISIVNCPPKNCFDHHDVFLLTTALEALTEEKKNRLVVLADVMNEPAIFRNWHWLLQILSQRVQFCSCLKSATVYLRDHSGHRSLE
jgi:hypothetical protein